MSTDEVIVIKDVPSSEGPKTSPDIHIDTKKSIDEIMLGTDEEDQTDKELRYGS